MSRAESTEGIFLLMTLESTLLPIPAEIVMPPAAYWAAQGQLSFFGVLICGILGNVTGAILMYLFFVWTGERFLNQMLKWRLANKGHLESAAMWVKEFGPPGVFFARLLPGVRQLVSIPAGVFSMRARNFIIATALGSALWCGVLVIWGEKILGSHPELLRSPEDMINILHKETFGFVLLIAIIAALYSVSVWYRVRHRRHQARGNVYSKDMT